MMRKIFQLELPKLRKENNFKEEVFLKNDLVIIVNSNAIISIVITLVYTFLSFIII